MMTLDDLKNRTIEILTCVDSGYFGSVAQTIGNIQITGTNNFDDLSAKALVLQTALTAAVPYLEPLQDKRKIFLLVTLFNDQETSIDIKNRILNNSAGLDEIPTLSNPLREMRAYLNTLNTFFTHAESLKKIYAERAQRSQLRMLTKSINPLQMDAQQDENEITTVLNKNTVIGTTQIGSCKGIVMSGKTAANKTVVSVGHYSTLDKDMILGMQSDLLKNQGLIENSLQVYLIGGCISGIPEALQFIMQVDLNIVDFKLGTNNGEDNNDATAVIISGQYPNEIFYSELPLENFYPRATSTNHASTATLAPYPFAFFVAPPEEYKGVILNDLLFLEWLEKICKEASSDNFNPDSMEEDKQSSANNPRKFDNKS